MHLYCANRCLKGRLVMLLLKSNSFQDNKGLLSQSTFSSLINLFFRSADSRKCPGCQARWLHKIPEVAEQTEELGM